MAANLSRTARGVRPGASGRNRARKVHVQAVGHEGDKDMRLDPTLELVENGAQRQVVLQVFKGRFDFDEQDIKLPQLSWVTSQEVCPKQVAAFPAADDSQLLSIQCKTETREAFCRGLGELDVH